MSTPYTFDRVVRIVITILVVLTLLYLLNILSTVLVPFFISLLFAYLLNPLVNFIQIKLRFKNRILSVLSTLVFITFCFAILFSFLLPSIMVEFQKAFILINKYTTDLPLENLLPEQIIDAYKNYINLYNVKDLITAENFEKLSSGTFKVLEHIFSSLSGLFYISITAFAILLYTIFILIDYNKITEGWKALVPIKYKDLTIQIADDLEEGMNSYFRAQSKIVLIVSILFIIGFRLIGLPMPIVLGISIGLLNFIPYLQLVGFIPAFMFGALYSAQSDTNLGLVFALITLVFGVVQLIQETLLTPKIMGSLTGLNPAIIMLSLSIWGALLGIVGMIIALPLTTLILSYYKRYLKNERLKR